MAHPRPILPPAESEAVRRNPNLLTWLRTSATPTPPSLSEPFAREIVREIMKRDANNQHLHTGREAGELRKFALRPLAPASREQGQPQVSLLRLDLVSTNPDYRPPAEAFVGQRVLYRVFAGTQARPGCADIVGQAVVRVQNLEQRWHGVAEIRVPLDMGRDYVIHATVVEAI